MTAPIEKTKTLLSVVIPIFNEGGLLPELYSRLKNVLNQLPVFYEIIFVDDGSQDTSYSFLQSLTEKDSGVKVIRLSRNFGHQLAITAGMDYCTGDVVVIMDGDLQDPPELIPKLIEKWKEGFDVVYAVRKKRKGERFLKLITAFFYYRIFRWITKVQIPADTGDFRLISQRALSELRKLRESHRLIRGMVSWVGFRQTGIEYERDRRYAGKTKFSLIKMGRFALDGITSFSNVPLRMATILGFIVSFFSLIKIGELLYSYYYKSLVPGWASIMVAVLFLGGVQLITIGIIGEYIGRIHEEVKNRPLYLIEESINFNSGEKTNPNQ